MSRKKRGSKRKKLKRSSGKPDTSVISPSQSFGDDGEDTAVQLTEGMERRLSESSTPLATDYSDRQLWRSVMHRFKSNQIEAAAVLQEIRETLSTEAASADQGEAEYHAAIIRVADAAIRDQDRRRAAEVRDSDGRRTAEVRTLHTRTDRDEDRKDTRARNDSWREILLMGITAVTFVCTVVLIFIGIASGQLLVFGVSTCGLLLSAGGIYRLFRPGKSGGEPSQGDKESAGSTRADGSDSH
jgi:hypothetical protein